MVCPSKKNARSTERVLPGTRNERFRLREIDLQPRVPETLTFKKRASNSRKVLGDVWLRTSHHESGLLKAIILARMGPNFFHRPRLDSASPRRYPIEPVRQGSPSNEDIRANFRGFTWLPLQPFPPVPSRSIAAFLFGWTASSRSWKTPARLSTRAPSTISAWPSAVAGQSPR